MRIPASFTAGDSVSWQDVAFAGDAGAAVTSANGWVLTYSFRGPQVAGNVDVAAVTSGTGWQTKLTALQTAGMNNGPAALAMRWQAYATLTDQRFTAGSGSLLVKPNLAAISANTVVEGRTPAEVNLANIEAEIAARITGGATLEYTIGNRSLKREPMAMLMTLRSQYRLIVYREKQAQAGANGGKLSNWVGVRFK